MKWYNRSVTNYKQNKYRVVLKQIPTPNDLGEMTETQLYGYLGTRLRSVPAAEALLQELEEKGLATTYFDCPPGPKVRVEIHRVAKNE